MVVVEPATADFGVQETVVFEAFVVTTKLYAPAVAGLLESPPKLAVRTTEEPAAVGVNFTLHLLKIVCLACESVQVELEKVPELLLDQMTVPVGATVPDS